MYKEQKDSLEEDLSNFEMYRRKFSLSGFFVLMLFGISVSFISRKWITD